MLILLGVFEGDINCDCIFTRFFKAPEAGGTAGKDTGGNPAEPRVGPAL